MTHAGKRRGDSGPLPQDRMLYGRRRGRPLRQQRRDLLRDLLPKLELAEPGPGEVLNPLTLFPAKLDDLWLEIGFGAGEHLAWQAKQNPHVGLLGAEFYINGVASLLRHVDGEEARNLRVMVGDGRALLQALPTAVLGRVFLLFPDPWPKARHQRRRFIQEDTLDCLARVMRPGAELRFATDHPDYLLWTLERLQRHPGFSWPLLSPESWRRRPDDWPPTRYEEKAIAAGRQPVYLRWQRSQPSIAS